MSRHLKRLAAPKSWWILRKEHHWITKPNPGPHPIERALPLLVIIRDYLKLADNAREARKIIKEGKVLVDKRVRKDHKFPVGLFDILEIPEADIRKIVLFDHNGRLILKDIPEKYTRYKLCKIINKTTIKGGHIQLNLYDGKNIIIYVKDPCNPVEANVYNTKDTILVDLNDYKTIVKHFKYQVGSYVYVIGGSNVGKVCRIKEIRVIRSPQPNLVKLVDMQNREFETIEDYVFVIGEEEPYMKEVFLS